MCRRSKTKNYFIYQATGTSWCRFANPQGEHGEGNKGWEGGGWRGWRVNLLGENRKKGDSKRNEFSKKKTVQLKNKCHTKDSHYLPCTHWKLEKGPLFTAFISTSYKLSKNWHKKIAGCGEENFFQSSCTIKKNNDPQLLLHPEKKHSLLFCG